MSWISLLLGAGLLIPAKLAKTNPEIGLYFAAAALTCCAMSVVFKLLGIGRT